ncbi:Ty3/gypsy retrotransposon protein [Quillaja saponaria]|uniref:Ty3/gypsy retrotransposon protein n=1 Tax=Quillaja saponaria TaxID=32244 RepID=A0AAD7PN44_QUISA|nr:Ty3/gypsy retrotransposon protein [Quillaja saponaria]
MKAVFCWEGMRKDIKQHIRERMQPPLHLPYVPGDSTNEAVDRSLIVREATLRLLKHHLLRAQDRMKAQADKERTDKEFAKGTRVYLRLQLYIKLSVTRRPFYKLAYRYFGPFQIVKRIGAAPVSSELPNSSVEDNLILQPQAILDRRFVKKQKQGYDSSSGTVETLIS